MTIEDMREMLGSSIEPDDTKDMSDEEVMSTLKDILEEAATTAFKDDTKTAQMRNKYDVIAVLKDFDKKLKSKERTIFRDYSEEFISLFRNNLKKFVKVIDNSFLPTMTEGWFYKVTFNKKHFILSICDCFSTAEVEDGFNEVVCYYEAFYSTYNLIIMDIDAVSVSEYAHLNGIEPVTVRQWIRRGKLHDAYKVGKEWMIPELASISNSENEDGKYLWIKDLANLSEEYKYLDDYSEASFEKTGANGNYILHLNNYKKREESKKKKIRYKKEERTITLKEKEKIELLLMQRPEVQYSSQSLVTLISMDENNTYWEPNEYPETTSQDVSEVKVYESWELL